MWNLSSEKTGIQNSAEGKRPKGLPSGKIGLAFVIPGLAALFFAVVKNSNVLAFIGLSLTFWGALFYFIRPVRYVQGSLLDSTVHSTYMTIDRIINDLKLKTKAYYIPPYPMDVYLPEHLKGLKEAAVFISGGKEGTPSVEDLAKSKFMIQNPSGVCVAPPGSGLLSQVEKELRKETSKLQLSELYECLPSVIVENLELAKEAEMREESGKLYLKLSDSVYRRLYSAEANLKSVHFLGCPIVSAVACAIAKSTGKPAAIQKIKTTYDGQTVEVWYQIVEVTA